MIKNLLLASCAAALGLAAAPASATIVSDAQGDWAPGYTGQKLDDLDVKAFSVDYDAGASLFHLKGTMWGNITAGTEGFYVIGVDTGSGPSQPAADDLSTRTGRGSRTRQPFLRATDRYGQSLVAQLGQWLARQIGNGRISAEVVAAVPEV